MLQNDYLVAIVAVDTAEKEPLKVWGWFHSFFIRLLKQAYLVSAVVEVDQYGPLEQVRYTTGNYTVPLPGVQFSLEKWSYLGTRYTILVITWRYVLRCIKIYVLNVLRYYKMIVYFTERALKRKKEHKKKSVQRRA